VKLLLDTHAALWWLADDARLGDGASSYLADAANVTYLSAAVVWEVAIKRSLGNLRAPDDLVEQFLGAGVQPLAVRLEHAAAVRGLPWHHRDPFDRLLVAQARSESAAIVSADAQLRAYGVPVVW
jgi:PIN domain nuclease of toxin-antitoxin system